MQPIIGQSGQACLYNPFMGNLENPPLIRLFEPPSPKGEGKCDQKGFP